MYLPKLYNFFSEIGVDRKAFSIMAAKARGYLVYLDDLPSVYANILKQEFLSAGADVALPRDALVSQRHLRGIIIANLSQINRVLSKLKRQPSFLRQLAEALREAIFNYNYSSYRWRVRKRIINIKQPLLMGVINVTPDSFSGDGLLSKGRNLEQEVKNKVAEFVKAGVKIIDVGGESSRPGARPVSTSEEIKRIMPVIKVIKKHFPRVLISLDTYKVEVAQRGIEAGASIINDISGLRHKEMREVILRYKVGAVIMHMKGKPSNMQRDPFYKDVVSEIYDFFSQAVKKCELEGISKEQLVLDPGIGFGKRLEDNLEIIRRLGEFKTLGLPLMLGTSRKSFIGTLTRRPVEGRLAGTIASCVLGVIKGAKILRIHDAREIRDAVLITKSINEN